MYSTCVNSWPKQTTLDHHPVLIHLQLKTLSYAIRLLKEPHAKNLCLSPAGAAAVFSHGIIQNGRNSSLERLISLLSSYWPAIQTDKHNSHSHTLSSYTSWLNTNKLHYTFHLSTYVRPLQHVSATFYGHPQEVLVHKG